MRTILVGMHNLTFAYVLIIHIRHRPHIDVMQLKEPNADVITPANLNAPLHSVPPDRRKETINNQSYMQKII